MNRYKLALFICAFAWGFGYVSMDHLVMTSSPILAIGLRFTFAALIVFIIYYKKIIKNIKNEIKPSLLLGSILFLAFVFQTLGLSMTTTSKNAFLTATNVLWVPLLLAIKYRRKIQLNVIISAVVMMIGIALVSLDGLSSINLGDILTLIGAIFFALHMIFIANMVDDKNLEVVVFAQLAITGILGIICSLVLGSTTIIFGFEFIISLFFSAFISTALCFFLQNYGVSKVEASIGAIILSLEALFGVVAAILIDSEPFNMITILGFIIMFSSILIAEYRN